MKRVRLDRSLFLVLAIILVLVVSGFVISRLVRTDEISELADDGEQLTVLIVLELPGERLITQALILDTGTSRAALFDIPSNTGVVVQSLNRVDGVDTVYWRDGIETYSQVVATLLGEPIDFYLALTMDSLETVTDLIEGVPLFIADVPSEGPDAIPIPTGDVVLDGAKMQSYVAYAPEGERNRERIVRSQRAVAGLLDRLGEKSDLIDDPATLLLLDTTASTNLDRQAIASFSRVLADLEIDRIITRQVEGTERLVETGDESEALLFPHQEGRWLVEAVRQVVENLRSTEALRDENIVITLEILNGTSTTGLARRTAELYRSYGFDVITVGNAVRDDVQETLVIDRVGNEVFVNRTAEIIRATSIDLDLENPAGVDVTILLGEDFDGRYVR